MEWQGERSDKVPRNIFELGLRHFLGAPGYVAAYAAWLVTAGDAANARALFERALAAAPPPEAGRALWDHYLKACRPWALGPLSQGFGPWRPAQSLSACHVACRCAASCHASWRRMPRAPRQAACQRDRPWRAAAVRGAHVPLMPCSQAPSWKKPE